MNGPEHYAEAERVLDHAEEHAAANSPEWYLGAVGAAQVHATLALAAATIETAAARGPGDVTQVWVDVLGMADARIYHSPGSLGPA